MLLLAFQPVKQVGNIKELSLTILNMVVYMVDVYICLYTIYVISLDPVVTNCALFLPKSCWINSCRLERQLWKAMATTGLERFSRAICASPVEDPSMIKTQNHLTHIKNVKNVKHYKMLVLKETYAMQCLETLMAQFQLLFAEVSRLLEICILRHQAE